MSNLSPMQHLHAELDAIECALQAKDFTQVQTRASQYRCAVRDLLQDSAEKPTRQQCVELRDVHDRLQMLIGQHRDDAQHWLQLRKKKQQAIQAYKRSCKRIFI